MPEIECRVKNCEYWVEGNVCSAEKIVVTTEMDSKMNGNTADIHFQARDEFATICHTFQLATITEENES